jgi:hypothetical protein
MLRSQRSRSRVVVSVGDKILSATYATLDRITNLLTRTLHFRNIYALTASREESSTCVLLVDSH